MFHTCLKSREENVKCKRDYAVSFTWDTKSTIELCYVKYRIYLYHMTQLLFTVGLFRKSCINLIIRSWSQFCVLMRLLVAVGFLRFTCCLVIHSLTGSSVRKRWVPASCYSTACSPATKASWALLYMSLCCVERLIALFYILLYWHSLLPHLCVARLLNASTFPHDL